MSSTTVKGKNRVRIQDSTTSTPAPRKRDRFGSREGSNLFLVNRAITNKPRTAREIVERSGAELKFFKPNDPQMGGYYTHLNRLAEQGLIRRVEGDDGKTRYCRLPKTATA